MHAYIYVYIHTYIYIYTHIYTSGSRGLFEVKLDLEVNLRRATTRGSEVRLRSTPLRYA
jgi:hypothetical protein